MFAPQVTFTGGGGTGAAATATLAPGRGGRAIASVTLTNPGSGYTSAPTVHFVNGFGGRNAAATASISGTVTGVNITNGGTGYTAASPPTVAFASGSGSGAKGNAVVSSGTLTITALGQKQQEPNHECTPESAGEDCAVQSEVRHTQLQLRRDSQGTGTVTIGGVPATVTSWTDSTITVNVPTLTTAQSSCTLAQQGVNTPVKCGELVITAGNGKQSIDAVTVTIGGKPPSYVHGENADQQCGAAGHRQRQHRSDH